MTINGYNMQFTWFEDFYIANMFGEAEVKRTFERAFNEWKDNVVALKELCFCLNLNCWAYDSKNNMKMMKLYGDLYYKALNYGYDHFEGAELNEFWKFLD